MAYKIVSVVGARPNFMKVAALCDAIKEYNQESAQGRQIDHLLVHTGQHYDANMSDFFFNDLELPKPNLFLGVGSGSHSVQTAKIMEGFESVLLAERPEVVIVVGDVNSTLACALVTKKTWCTRGSRGESFIPRLAHVEAGLRSFDRTMPEEINRIVTDSISDYLFTTEESANQNLRREGIPEEKIHFVGNVMIDTLLRCRAKVCESTILNDLQLCQADGAKPYAILTLHRPSNVDNPETFAAMLESFLELSRHMPIIFPAHPRTLKQIQEADLGDYFVDHFLEGPEPWDSRVRIRLVPPLGYLDFLQLMSNAKIVLTDSGGIQEETTILGVPCITLRENTERPVTLQHGTNVLAGTDPKRILEAFSRVLRNEKKPVAPPQFWDGCAAKRIVQILLAGRQSSRVATLASQAEPGVGENQHL
ncbi:MAG TPA: UDP-N-acetylglucosamine 2-epimerase (non-hydrolyzing) [Candidatus Binatia bacterium]|nr:UDP-N-acetylglucosamine 2-epimerase (non-hydrolyzing) [Candidatus Binatia bacterium]